MVLKMLIFKALTVKTEPARLKINIVMKWLLSGKTAEKGPMADALKQSV